MLGEWLGGAIDAWLLKIAIQEVLGYPVRLVLDRQISVEDDYANMASGQYHIHPEVWLMDDVQKVQYQKYVVGQKTVVSCGPLGVFGRSGWYVLESEVERWPSLAGESWLYGLYGWLISWPM